MLLKSCKHAILAGLFFTSIAVVDNIVAAQTHTRTNTNNTKANTSSLIAPSINSPSVAYKEVSLNDIASGQLLFSRQQNNSATKYLQAPNLTSTVDINIQGIVANTRVKQTFSNTSNEWQHALYVFPLPDNAAVNQLSIHVAGRKIQGIVKEKKAAKRIYNKAKKAGKKAALLQQYRANLFSTHVANIPPNETITVELNYFQQVEVEHDMFSLHFPMAITPRYQPAKAPLAEGEAFIPEAQLPDLQFHAPTSKTPEKPLSAIDLTVTLESGAALKKLTSINHSAVITQQSNDKFIVSLPQQTPNKDFVLTWQYQANTRPTIVNFSAPFNQHQYGLLMVLPHHKEKTIQQARELVFILDRSGSMAGDSLAQAKQAFQYALQTLEPHDTFQLIDFSNNASAFFEKPVAATKYNKNTAWQYVNALVASGGTNIMSALSIALNNQQTISTSQQNLPLQPVFIEEKNIEKRPLTQIVFLTDGAVGNEAEIFSMIDKNIGDKRLFTVGLGTAPNRYFMNKAAEVGRGSYQFISHHRQLKQQMTQLFNKLDNPVLTSIGLSLLEQNELLSTSPSPIPDVYAGEPIFISYKLASDKTSKPLAAMVTGNYLGSPWQFELADLTQELAIKQAGYKKSINKKHDINGGINDGIKQSNEPAAPPALATLWARRKIDDHYRALMLNKEHGAKQSIIDLALSFNLVTPFTSLVAVENTPSRPLEKAAKNKQLKNQLPAGQRMPKTALHWQWQLVIAALLALVACILLFLIYLQTPTRNVTQAQGGNNHC